MHYWIVFPNHTTTRQIYNGNLLYECCPDRLYESSNFLFLLHKILQEEPKMWNSAAGKQTEEGAERSGIRCSAKYVVVYFVHTE